jgi:hypothetical protein
MRAAIPKVAVFALVGWFQFAIYPGHSVALSDGQIFTPQMERLESPGLLTRDLVATHPNLTFTIFDEATLLLHRGNRLNWKTCIEIEGFIGRTAALGGIVLLAEAAGLSSWWAILLAAGIGVVGVLPGIEFAPFGLDITPSTLSLGFTLLGTGLFVHEKPLLTGLAAGLGLIYDPRLAAPFWLIVLTAFVADRSLRRMIRPILTILAIFILLLANFAQLQPATAETRGMFEHLPPVIEAVQKFRTPELWVSGWQPRSALLYLALFSLGAWAVAALWKELGRPLRWVLCGLPLIGIATLPLSAALLDWGHIRLVPLAQPARTVAFTALIGAVSCAIAALRLQSRERWLFAAGPLLLLIAAWLPIGAAHELTSTENAARWARDNTWGASMFLFADGGQGLAPGQFRAQATRAVWVDWQTGRLCDSSDLFADEWRRRWQDTMTDGFSDAKIRRLLALPIDYFVVDASHPIAHGKPVFADTHWAIYDAHELRSVLHPAS